MKKYIFSIVLLFSSFIYSQQPLIDSLTIKLQKSNNKELKAKIYVKLAAASLRINDSTKFSQYTLILDSLIHDIKNPRVKGASYKLTSILEYDRENFQKAANFSEKAIRQFIIAKDSVQVGKSVNSTIKSFIKLNKLAESEELYLKYQSWINPKWNYKIAMDLSKHYITIDDFDKTSYYLAYCHKLANQLNDPQLIGKVYYRIAGMNRDLKNIDEALKNIRLAIQYLNPKKNAQLYGASYFTLGSILEKQELRKDALSALDSAYFYYRGKKSKRSRAMVLSKKANILFELEQYAEARTTVDKAIEENLELNNNHSLSYDYLRLSNILFYGEQKKDSAIYYAEKSLTIAKRYNIKLLVKTVQYNLSTFLKEKGNFKDAFKYLKEAYKYQDSLYTTDVSEKMKEIEEKFQNEKKEKELAIEREAKKQLQLENAKLNAIFFVVGSVIVIAIIILFFYLRIKKQKTENERQKSSLEISRLEKEVEAFEKAQLLRQSRNEALTISIQEKFYIHLKKYFDISDTQFHFWNLQASSGLTEKEIALKTNKSIGTIDGQRSRLYEKLRKKMNKRYTRSSSVSLYLNEYKKFVNGEFIKLEAN